MIEVKRTMFGSNQGRKKSQYSPLCSEILAIQGKKTSKDSPLWSKFWAFPWATP